MGRRGFASATACQLDEPLVDPNAIPLLGSEPEPEPLQEAGPLLDPDEPLTSIWLAGTSLWTQTPLCQDRVRAGDVDGHVEDGRIATAPNHL